MRSRNKMGISITLIFVVLALALTLYNIFFIDTSVTPSHATGPWFTGFFTLLAIFLSVSMLRSKNITLGVFNIVCLITAGIFCVFLGLYWILICLLIALIGCIMHKANITH